MRLTKADRARIESALVGLMLTTCGGHDGGADANATIEALVAGTPDDRQRKNLRHALRARVRLWLGHIRKGREAAAGILNPAPGFYRYPNAEEIAARMRADEPKHARELRAARRLLRAVCTLPTT